MNVMEQLNELRKQLLKNPPVVKDLKEYNKREFSGNSIDDILKKASDSFNIPKEDLVYQIISKPKKGFWSFFQSKWVLLVWSVTNESYLVISKNTKDDEPSVSFRDGKVKVLIKKSGVFLNYLVPLGEGKEATQDEVTMLLAKRGIFDFSRQAVQDFLESKRGGLLRVAEWIPFPENDSKANLEVSNEKMEAYITLSPPVLRGRILDEDEIIDVLKSKNVCFGIDNNAIRSMLNEEIYNIPVLVAKGKPPVDGTDAYIDFQFSTPSEHIDLKETESGQIDYKDVNQLVNVLEGQLLAIKMIIKPGVDGVDVEGNTLPYKKGKDVSFLAGENVTLSENGLEVIAKISGRPSYHLGEFSVYPIYEVKGNVDFTTGNIIFLGSILVHGNVKSGFIIKASGDIEIKGNIDDAQVESERDVIIRKGINGKKFGFVRAGRDLYCKFIENAKVYVTNDAYVQENILHSQVDCGSRVICYGRKGKIVGGRIRAAKEIAAKYLGAPAYTLTALEVGVNPKYKEKESYLEEEIDNANQEIQGLNSNIEILARLEKRVSLPPDKKKLFEKMKQAKAELIMKYEDMVEDLQKVQSYLRKLNIKGYISAKTKVFPGVQINTNGAQLLLKDGYRGTTFLQKNNKIVSEVYNPSAVVKKMISTSKR